MIHEFLGLNGGKVIIDDKPIVLSNDPLFIENMYFLFSDITDTILQASNELMKKVGVNTQNNSIKSLDELKEIIESFPQLQKDSAVIKKHLTIMSVVNKIINERKLFDISKLEQDIVCDGSKYDIYQTVLQIIDGEYDEIDKLRVALLYALKYEEKAKTIIEDMTQRKMSNESIELISIALKYAGKSKRPIEIFNKVKSVLGFVKKTVAGVENVFLQHKPVLESLIEQLIQNQLLDKFPYCRGAQTQTREYIIYIVGGVTFEEELVIATRNRLNPTTKIIIGGSEMLNTSQFIDHLKMMK